MTALALFGLSFGTCLAAAAAAYRWIIRPLQQHDREERSQRTPADVLADADAYRARRQAEQAADEDDFDISDAELADVLAIWSDDMHNQQREEGQQ